MSISPAARAPVARKRQCSPGLRGRPRRYLPKPGQSAHAGRRMSASYLTPHALETPGLPTCSLSPSTRCQRAKLIRWARRGPAAQSFSMNRSAVALVLGKATSDRAHLLLRHPAVRVTFAIHWAGNILETERIAVRHRAAGRSCPAASGSRAGYSRAGQQAVPWPPPRHRQPRGRPEPGRVRSPRLAGTVPAAWGSAQPAAPLLPGVRPLESNLLCWPGCGLNGHQDQSAGPSHALAQSGHAAAATQSCTCGQCADWGSPSGLLAPGLNYKPSICLVLYLHKPSVQLSDILCLHSPAFL